MHGDFLNIAVTTNVSILQSLSYRDSGCTNSFLMMPSFSKKASSSSSPVCTVSGTVENAHTLTVQQQAVYCILRIICRKKFYKLPSLTWFVKYLQFKEIIS